MANTLIFFAENRCAKATHIFAAKISMYLKIPLIATTANEFVINELVKLMMF